MATAVATLGGGCFWCLEAAFIQLRGVLDVTSGYCGGHVAQPSYGEVCAGDTGHAEVVHVTFDPDIIDYRTLLLAFFAIHDPTTPNRQGHDVGSQYRSVIFTHGAEQQRITLELIETLTREQTWPSGRHRGDPGRALLAGGGTPPELLRQQSTPALLHGGRRAQGGEIARSLQGSAQVARHQQGTGPVSRRFSRPRIGRASGILMPRTFRDTNAFDMNKPLVTSSSQRTRPRFRLDPDPSIFWNET